MSVVHERKRGTIPLGSRPIPLPDDLLRQLDHPIVRDLLTHSGDHNLLQRLEEEAADHSGAYLSTVTNASLRSLENYVLQQLKGHTGVGMLASFQDLRWASMLPPSIQKRINHAWHNRPRRTVVVATGYIYGISAH